MAERSRGMRRRLGSSQTCPLLLRVFTKVGAHHVNEEFSKRRKEPKDEVQIYTWKDATLRELTDLVKEVALPARRRNARIDDNKDVERLQHMLQEFIKKITMEDWKSQDNIGVEDVVIQSHKHNVDQMGVEELTNTLRDVLNEKRRPTKPT